ncbi:flagellar biosynthesis protein FlgC [Aquibium carbonis]|uniref:Flagellar biosynthesis protein FlgC n=1 Tax=Aquibium carbonis TaxID=2495581 RepID=A0A3R9Y118_9HYPH|nr:flagellar basal body rod C-terminal domain-containing protein [Aquibium carbonis]RST81681.1 flagellar biosynthesis protein FlgC [Aquibium carbonis]
MIGNAAGIALSGMLAESTRLNVAAGNIANARTTGALEPAAGATTVYQPLQVESASTLGGGTVAIVRPLIPGYTAAFEPSASFADENGLVAAPNVDLLGEVTGLMQASLAFRANLAVFETASDMMRALFDLGED